MTHVRCLSEIVSRSAAPERPALVQGETSLSYAQLHAASEKIAEHLGDVRSARVGLLFRDAVRFVPAFFGALLAGASVVPLNPEAGAAAVDALLRRSRCARLLSDAGGQLEFLPGSAVEGRAADGEAIDRKSTRLNSSHRL